MGENPIFGAFLNEFFCHSKQTYLHVLFGNMLQKEQHKSHFF